MKAKTFVLFLALIAALGFSFSASAEVGVTDTEIIIGSHQDLSGPIAGWGTQVKMGLEMRAKECNDAGGIHGRKIKLIIEDNAYDPKKAIMVTNKLISRDKVFAFVGNMGSPTAGATKPLISKKKIPQMFPLTAASLFFDPFDRYSFGGWVPYYDQMRCATKWFAENKGYTKFGIMYQDDEFGQIAKKGLEDQLAAMGLKVTAAESYKRGATDFSSQIAKLKKADVEVVCLGTVIRETVGALKEAKKLNWDVDMVGISPAYTTYVVGLCLKAGFSPDGFYATGQTPYIYPDSPYDSVREWCAKHKEMFGKDPDIPTSAGWAALDYFIKVAEKAGPDLTREKWIDTAEHFGVYKDTMFHGVDIEFTPKQHQGAYDAILSQVENNKFVQVADVSFRD
ncbi:ABC transporter substrate-binding protein [Desulfatibacillum aliphaticivorans]|uniref:ABC transporter substrate-binding protein n=1 Tax=Desulfatibacillum aliphaticivorans TaxID=218208 RepID=UPI0004083B10|nr:ABC transporter substrate-binding protein [Desulfatibacillum aliphaticivorans]